MIIDGKKKILNPALLLDFTKKVFQVYPGSETGIGLYAKIMFFVVSGLYIVFFKVFSLCFPHNPLPILQ